MTVMMFVKVRAGLPSGRLSAVDYARTITSYDALIRDVREELDLKTEILGKPIYLNPYKACRDSCSALYAEYLALATSLIDEISGDKTNS